MCEKFTFERTDALANEYNTVGDLLLRRRGEIFDWHVKITETKWHHLGSECVGACVVQLRVRLRVEIENRTNAVCVPHLKICQYTRHIRAGESRMQHK